MDCPVDAESPCGAAVPQRTVRKWHCSELELGKVGQLRLLPVLPPLCAMAVPSALTHSSILYWEFTCSLLRAFDLPLYSATELQSAPVWSTCLPLQLSDHPRAVLLSSRRAEAAATDRAPRFLCVCSCDQLNSAVPQNSPPCCSPLAYFHFVPSSLSCCPLKSSQELLCIAVARSFFPPAFLLLQLE